MLWKLRAKTLKINVTGEIIPIYSKSKGKSAPQAKNFGGFNIRNAIFNRFSFKSDTKSWKIFRLRRDSLTKKNTTKNSPLRKPPLYSDLGEYRGGFLNGENFLPQKCYFLTFQKSTTFWIFFIRFFLMMICVWLQQNNT